MKIPNLAIRILVLIFTFLLFLGCNKEDEKPNLFTLYVFNDANIGAKTKMIVSFACDNAVIPEVTVNGYRLEKINLSSSVASGNMFIPYSDTINFEVKSNGKVTSGQLLTPRHVTKMYCNEKLVARGSYIPYKYNIKDYHFTWDTVTCDHYIFEANATILSKRVLLENYIKEHTFNYSITENTISFYFSTVNGARIEPGVKPNFSGDCGDGICYVETKGSYVLDVNRTTTKGVIDEKYNINNVEDLHQIHLSEFSEYLGF